MSIPVCLNMKWKGPRDRFLKCRNKSKSVRTQDIEAMESTSKTCNFRTGSEKQKRPSGKCLEVMSKVIEGKQIKKQVKSYKVYKGLMNEMNDKVKRWPLLKKEDRKVKHQLPAQEMRGGSGRRTGYPWKFSKEKTEPTAKFLSKDGNET